jgi:hypothetical protein
MKSIKTGVLSRLTKSDKNIKDPLSIPTTKNLA